MREARWASVDAQTALECAFASEKTQRICVVAFAWHSNIKNTWVRSCCGTATTRGGVAAHEARCPILFAVPLALMTGYKNVLAISLGRLVQVDPMAPKFKSAGILALELKM